MLFSVWTAVNNAALDIIFWIDLGMDDIYILLLFVLNNLSGREWKMSTTACCHMHISHRGKKKSTDTKINTVIWKPWMKSNVNYHLDGKIVWNALKWASWWPKELIRCHLFNNSKKKKKRKKKCVWRWWKDPIVSLDPLVRRVFHFQFNFEEKWEMFFWKLDRDDNEEFRLQLVCMNIYVLYINFLSTKYFHSSK